MPTPHALDRIDDNFFDTALVRAEHTAIISTSPDRLWRTLAADDAVQAWSKAITSAHWDPTIPRGIGSMRTVTILGAVTVNERFYRWEQNTRMTFGATTISRPLCHAFGEDYILEEAATGTRLTWRAAMAPRLPSAAHRALSSLLAGALVQLTRGISRSACDY